MQHIPKQGTPAGQLLQQMEGFKANDARWRDGRTWSMVYHLSKEYATFLQSVDGAVLANGNPFRQAGPIISSLRSTAKIIGVFTSLIFGQRVDAVER